MNEQIFPPSPNWYLSSAFACNSSGLLAYGARNNLVIVRTECDSSEKTLPKVEIIPNAHKERVTVVVFSPHNVERKTLSSCIATAGDDAVVKVWDLQSMTPILAHVSHGMESKLCCMDWSQANPDLIVSMDDSNNIVCWDLPSNATHTLFCGKLSPTALSCCPLNKDLIAIGCRSGLVCIMNIQGRGKILFRMRGHDSEVVSFAWCPVAFNIFEAYKGKNERKEDTKDLLLASAAKERTIYVWRANTDGRYEIALTIPSNLMADKRSNKGGAGDMNWVSLCWPQCNNIICSTRLGRIISWDLKACCCNNKSAKNSGAGDSAVRMWKPVHSSHSRIIFSVVTAHVGFDVNFESLDVENWKLSQTQEPHKPLIIWSSSQDRLIVGYDLNANKEVVNIPTIGGIVYCIATSPIDPNRIAFGVSDAVIRVWNLSGPSPFEVILLWQKIRGKVTSIAWHPTQENCLAFGTAEGRVGVFDSLGSNKPPVLLRPYHTKSLYVVIWGPALFDSGDDVAETKYVLYSCGEGNVVQYDISNPEAEPKNINDLSQLYSASRKSLIRTDLAWKPDNSVLALGNEDGSVQLVCSSQGTLLQTIYAHKSLVQSLAWHPEGTATDVGYSPCQHWLAIASKKSPIKVYNLTPILEGEGNGEAECVAVFNQHKQCVVGMAWSPHVSGQLVSVSFDESAQVWDVLQQQPVANYSLHVGVLHSCCWSPLDPDLVLTGSADSTLRVWRISTLDRALPSDKKKERTAQKKTQNLQFSTKHSVAPPADKDQATEESPGLSLMPISGMATREPEQHSAKGGRLKARSFFPVWAHMWQGSLGNILDRFQQYLNEGGIPNTEANLLGSRANVLKLLELEEMHHAQNSNMESAQQMALWRGDIGQTIRDASKKKKLTDWLVSLAPMVSQRLWMDSCRMYAEQLVTEGKVHKAASYLLACHKVEEAIQLFLQQHLFREALAVAKLRLSAEDPLTGSITHDWSQQLIMEGHFERAGECLLSLGDLTGAAEILGRRNDTRCLSLAASIAAKGKSESMSKCYAKNCVLQCLLHKTWDLALKVTTEFAELQPLTVLIFTHKTFHELLTGKIVIQDPLPDWLQQQYKTEFCKDPFDVYEPLEKIMEKNVPDTKSRLWLAVSGELALSCCSSQQAVRLQHLVRAANMCYSYQLMHANIYPLLQYLRWLAPQEVIEKKVIFKSEPPIEKEAQLFRSLRFYFYAGYFSWLQSELTSSNANSDPIHENEEEACATSAANHLHRSTQSQLSSEKIQTTSFPQHLCEEEGSLETSCDIPGPSPQHVSKKEISQKFNWKDLMISSLTSYSEELALEAPALLYFKHQVEIKRWEQEVATLVAQKHQNVTESGNMEPTSNEEQNESELLKGLEKLDQLKELREAFECQRGSAPNPFVTYCHFKSACDYLIREKNMENLKSVLEQAAQQWLSIAAGI